MVNLQMVVVATDFGESSVSAVLYAKEVARRFGAEIRIVHVAEDVSASYYGIEGTVPDFGRLQEQVETDARAKLDAMLTEDDRRALSAQTVLLTSNLVPASLVAYAKRVNAGLLVLGTHGRTGVAHFFLGSVAERVVRTAQCPVLTVPEPVPDSAALKAEAASSRAVGADV